MRLQLSSVPNCPHCGKRLKGLRRSWDRERVERLRDLGRCTACEGELTDVEFAARRWRCAKCSAIHNNRMKLKRGVQATPEILANRGSR